MASEESIQESNTSDFYIKETTPFPLEEELEEVQDPVEKSGKPDSNSTKEISQDKLPIKENQTPSSPKRQTFIECLLACEKLKVTSILITVFAIITMVYLGRISDDRKQIQSSRVYLTDVTIDHVTKGNTLKHVWRVLNSLGYRQDKSITSLKDLSMDNKDWNLLWTFNYTFIDHYEKLKNLGVYQKINHFPGCEYITEKDKLSTTPLKYNLPAFKLPSEKETFLNFAAKHPEKKYVINHNRQGKIEIKSSEEIKTGGYLDTNGSFIQEFLEKPLLVGGHMFNIEVYTIITSIDPLRIYIYNGDFPLRFCPEKFHPFDSKNVDKYVVSDIHPDIDIIQNLYDKLGYRWRDSLSAYLTIAGRNTAYIWNQIDEAIGMAIVSKQSDIKKVMAQYKSKRNFFELLRFDCLIDEDLNVFILEANISPKLTSERYGKNVLIYEQVLFNLFGLVGLADRIQKDLSHKFQENIEMETSEKNILVQPNVCSGSGCKNNCVDLVCKVCKFCLQQNKELEQDLREAHREHLNRGDCKRIYPPAMVKSLVIILRY